MISAQYHGTSSREIRRTFARRNPGLVPSDGGNWILGTFGEERRTTNVGGKRVTHNLVAPGVLQARDAHDGDVEAPGKQHISVRVATRHLDSAEEALGKLSRYRFGVWCKRDVRFDATRNNFR